jgi:hypothetical protein
LVFGFLLTTSRALSGPLVGRIDDFEDGTIQEWSGGAEYNNISDGGPDGDGDNYLELLRPTPTAPFPFHIGMKNTTTWAGDYLTAGITAIEMDVNTFSVPTGPNDLSLRIVLFGPGGAFSSREPVTIVTGGDWQHIKFGLTRSDLVRLFGSGGIYTDPWPVIDNLTETLRNVETLLIRHDSALNPTPIGNHPEHILATIGIDNITAVPGPSPSYDVAWTFDNMENQSYVLNSYEPNNIVLGDFETENPTLLLSLGKRYQVTILDAVNHPFELIAKNTDSGQDDILLSANPDVVGPFERSVPGVGWIDNGIGTVTFTLTDELYNAMMGPNKRPGYRCGVHVVNMRGNFDICTAPITGDLNGDCKVDFSDLELFILNWMGNNIVP